jgi:hypothetical protein
MKSIYMAVFLGLSLAGSNVYADQFRANDLGLAGYCSGVETGLQYATLADGSKPCVALKIQGLDENSTSILFQALSTFLEQNPGRSVLLKGDLRNGIISATSVSVPFPGN